MFFAVLAMALGSQAIAADLFEGGQLRAIKYGDPIAATDTIGGYPVYPGDAHWTFVSARVGAATTGAGDSTAIGTVQMIHLESRALLARQTITANLGSGPGTSWAGSPCAPNHLVSRNQGRGRFDNCMAIDAINITVDNAPVLFLSVVLTNTGSNGRYYRVALDLNPALLGLRGTTLADWAPEILAIRENQQAFLKKLSVWAETLQDRSNKAFDYSHPQDAYAEVRSYRTLLPVPGEFENRNFPLPFLSTVEDLRHKKGYSSMAYSYVEGKGPQRWSSSAGSPSMEAADSAAMKGCENGKPADLPPCVSYRITTDIPNMGGAARLTIVNKSPANADIFWVNGTTLKLYKTLPPGQAMEQSTFIGHQWRAVISNNPVPIDLTATESAKVWELR